MPENQVDPIATRWSLLSRLKDLGDQTSWSEFFERYWQLLYHVAKKAGLTDAEAQEVVQETVLGVARNIASFRTNPAHGSFSAWLMHQTRWRIADQFRKRAQARDSCRSEAGVVGRAPATPETALTSTTDRIPDPAGLALEKVWDEEWQKTLLTAALEQVKLRVSAGQYQIFDLHVLQQVPAPAAARMLRTSVAAVYMAKYRLSRLLKKEIARLQKELR